jgi:NAD+ synthase (glutamine-hydrolysing)
MLKKYGFVRVGAAVPEMKVADVDFNTDEIIKLINDAEGKNIQIIVFPELSITGYTCADLFHQNILLNEVLVGLKKIIDSTSKLNITSIVGMPLTLDNQLYNTAVVINKGHILGIVPKTYIPNYSEFYEKRWFASSLTMISKDMELFGETVPVGTDLLFQSINNKDICFGIEICEDLWTLYPPSINQALNGATILFNLSASNELIGKYEYRRSLVNGQSGRCIAGYIYTSCGINESTTDVLFSGHAMISENGSMLEESERFKFDSQIIYNDIDIQKLMTLRYKDMSYMGVIPNQNKIRSIKFDLVDIDTNLKRKYERFPFVPRDDKKRDERCNEIFNIQCSALAKRLKHSITRHS